MIGLFKKAKIPLLEIWQRSVQFGHAENLDEQQQKETLLNMDLDAELIEQTLGLETSSF